MQHAGPSVLGEGGICWLSALPSPADLLQAEELAFHCSKKSSSPRCVALVALAAPLMLCWGRCWHIPGPIGRTGVVISRSCPWCLGG